jgi:serine/threonine protein phosphatase PrpC
MNPRPGMLWLDVGAGTHVGRVRTLNEDRYVARADTGVFVVADGMGGHDNGEVASSIIVRLMDAVAPAQSAAALLADVEAKVIQANRQVLDYAREHGKAMVGSTLAALLIHSGFYACLWSGDSRVYLIRAGMLTQLSRDHTEARDLVESGMLTPEEAAVWPRRNVLTRAIGAAPEPELEMEQGPVQTGDVFVLCSDGLTNHVADGEIHRLAAGAPPQEAVKALIALALERGGTDNVTVVVVACRERPATAAGATAAHRPSDVWE